MRIWSACLLLTAAVAAPATAQVGDAGFPLAPVTGQRVPCSGGTATATMAGQPVAFACNGIDLMSYLPLSSMGGATNDGASGTGTASLATTWGWTDPQTGREYALLGRSDGTAFVDVTDPVNPVYVGRLRRPTTRTDAPASSVAPSSWRELKVLGSVMAVVSEAAGAGMQTFDLTGLRAYAGTPIEFAETGRYTGFGRAHNVLVSEASGVAIATGMQGTQNANTTTPGAGCALGLHVVSLANAAAPTFDRCYNAPALYSSRGYTHDAQCVRYRGPDTRYTGREICLLSNERGLFVTDITDRGAIATIGSVTYPNVAYTHQAWFTDDQRHAYVDDELDEQRGLVPKTRTFIVDLADLTTPIVAATYDGPSTAIDHNQYIRGRYVFQANYTAGLRVLDATTPTAPVEAAFFDAFPASDATVFEGLWNVYPYFASGTIVAGGIDEGLFVFRAPGLALSADTPDGPGSSDALRLVGAHPVADVATLRLASPVAGTVHVEALDAAGRRVAVVYAGTVTTEARTLAWDTRGVAPGVYTVRAVLPDGAVATRRVVVAR